MDSSSEFAISLIDDLLSGDISVRDFCSRYEQHWNFDWPERKSHPAADKFRSLFDTVAWYSPFPEERAVIPNYTSDEQVLAIARQVREAIGA